MKSDVFLRGLSYVTTVTHRPLTKPAPSHRAQRASQVSSCRINGEEARMKDYAVPRCLGYYAERP